jgi:hypothetical protein
MRSGRGYTLMMSGMMVMVMMMMIMIDADWHGGDDNDDE